MRRVLYRFPDLEDAPRRLAFACAGERDAGNLAALT